MSSVASRVTSMVARWATKASASRAFSASAPAAPAASAPANVGILAMETYVSSRYVCQEALEKFDGVSAGKYTVGASGIRPGRGGFRWPATHGRCGWLGGTRRGPARAARAQAP